MTRINAFLIHLGISAVIFFILLYFIIFHWYPFPLFSYDGGWQGIRIIAGVDLVLGPLLTLIVFKPGKPSLKMDLSIIAAIQIAALTWGTWITYTERPYVMIFSQDYFKPIPRYQLEEAGVPVDKINKLSNTNPRLIYADLPRDDIKLSALRHQAVQSRQPLYMFYTYYARFSDKAINDIKESSLDINYILDTKPETSKKTQEKIKFYANDHENLLFFTLRSRYAWNIAVFDTQTFKIIDIINLNPQPYLD